MVARFLSSSIEEREGKGEESKLQRWFAFRCERGKKNNPLPESSPFEKGRGKARTLNRQPFQRES
jgi:hypothetical protein